MERYKQRSAHYHIFLVVCEMFRVRQWECPWLSNGSIAKVCHLCDVAHRRVLKSGSASDWSSYRILCSRVNSMLRSAKSEYFGGLAASFRSKLSKFWRHFQCLSK